MKIVCNTKQRVNMPAWRFLNYLLDWIVYNSIESVQIVVSYKNWIEHNSIESIAMLKF